MASGPVVGGVIGTLAVPKFTLFGETVSRAEEMEKTSQPLKVQCSEDTMKFLQSNFQTNNAFRCKRRKSEDCEEKKTWWIVRPSDDTISDSDNELDLSSGTAALSKTSTGNGTTASEIDRSNTDRKSTIDFEKYLMTGTSSLTNNKHPEESSTKTCMEKIEPPIRSTGRMFRVAGSNRRILLSTILTFAILCGIGIAILYIYSNEYEQDKYNEAENVARKADRWLDNEISKALLPLFAMSELLQIVGKWDTLPSEIEGTSQYNKGDSVFNNVTGICDDPTYLTPFNDIASSIKQSSGMQKILVNIQAAPRGQYLCISCQAAFLIDSFRLKAYLIKLYISHSTHFIRSWYISRSIMHDLPKKQH